LHRVFLIFKWNHRRYRTEDLFACDTIAIVHVIKDRRLNVETLCKLLRTSSARGQLGFLLANFKILIDPIVLLFADQRPHLRLAIEWWAKLDPLRLLRHGLNELLIDRLLHQDAAARRAYFPLINE